MDLYLWRDFNFMFMPDDGGKDNNDDDTTVEVLMVEDR